MRSIVNLVIKPHACFANEVARLSVASYAYKSSVFANIGRLSVVSIIMKLFC